MTLLCQITHTARIQDLHFVSLPGNSTDSEVLLVAGEDKKVAVYEEGNPNTTANGDNVEAENGVQTTTYKVIGHFVGHDSRYAPWSLPAVMLVA